MFAGVMCGGSIFRHFLKRMLVDLGCVLVGCLCERRRLGMVQELYYEANVWDSAGLCWGVVRGDGLYNLRSVWVAT